MEKKQIGLPAKRDSEGVRDDKFVVTGCKADSVLTVGRY